MLSIVFQIHSAQVQAVTTDLMSKEGSLAMLPRDAGKTQSCLALEGACWWLRPDDVFLQCSHVGSREGCGEVGWRARRSEGHVASQGQEGSEVVGWICTRLEAPIQKSYISSWFIYEFFRFTCECRYVDRMRCLLDILSWSCCGLPVRVHPSAAFWDLWSIHVAPALEHPVPSAKTWSSNPRVILNQVGSSMNVFFLFASADMLIECVFFSTYCHGASVVYLSEVHLPSAGFWDLWSVLLAFVTWASCTCERSRKTLQFDLCPVPTLGIESANLTWDLNML